MVEESFAFLEDNRVAVRPEHDEFSESVAEFMQRNKMKVRILHNLDLNKDDSIPKIDLFYLLTSSD